MANEKELDVKQSAESSAAQDATAAASSAAKTPEQDVKPKTTAETIEAFADTLKLDTAPSAEEKEAEGEIQNLNPTEGEEGQPEGAEGEGGEKEERSTEGSEQGTEGEKHEEAVPYERFAEVNKKLKEVEPLVEQYRNLENYCNEHNITPKDFQAGLDLMRLINSGDYSGALEKLKPVVGQLEAAAGERLPEDLVDELKEADQELKDGLITQTRYEATVKRLKEVAKLRGAGAQAKVQGERSAAQVRQQQQEQLTVEFQKWAESKQKNNPLFKPKATAEAQDGMFEDFQDKLNRYWVNTPPKTIAEAVALAERAFAYVKDTAKRYGPKVVGKKVLTTVGSSSTKNGEPKSLEERIDRFARERGIA